MSKKAKLIINNQEFDFPLVLGSENEISIDVKKLRVENYDHSLGALSTVSSPSGTGITHKDNNVTIITSGNIGLGNSGGAALTSNTFGIAVEEQGVSVSTGDHISDVNVDTNDILNDGGNDGNAYLNGGIDVSASSNITVNSYLFFLADGINKGKDAAKKAELDKKLAEEKNKIAEFETKDEQTSDEKKKQICTETKEKIHKIWLMTVENTFQMRT